MGFNRIESRVCVIRGQTNIFATNGIASMKRIFINDGKNTKVKFIKGKSKQSKSYTELKKRKALLDEQYRQQSNSR